MWAAETPALVNARNDINMVMIPLIEGQYHERWNILTFLKTREHEVCKSVFPTTTISGPLNND
jgi:hypothetical protein